MNKDLADRALFFLSKENWFRKRMVRFIRWRPFDWFFLAAILANCVTLAMASNKPGFDESALGLSLAKSNLVFVALFITEAFCKITGLGFVLAQHTYLRDGEREILQDCTSMPCTL